MLESGRNSEESILDTSQIPVYVVPCESSLVNSLSNQFKKKKDSEKFFIPTNVSSVIIILKTSDNVRTATGNRTIVN